MISLYDPMFEEVAAFEELIGSHGGLGGVQTQPLLLHPTEWELDEDLLGAPAVHRQIRRWAERHLDLRFGRDGTAATAADARARTGGGDAANARARTGGGASAGDRGPRPALSCDALDWVAGSLSFPACSAGEPSSSVKEDAAGLDVAHRAVGARL